MRWTERWSHLVQMERKRDWRRLGPRSGTAPEDIRVLRCRQLRIVKPVELKIASVFLYIAILRWNLSLTLCCFSADIRN